MTSPNLVLTFTLLGDSRIHVRDAARIRIDGRHGLTLFDEDGGDFESLNLNRLQSLKIQAVHTAEAVS